jgi:hypothetical protein
MRVLFTTPKKRWLPFAWVIRKWLSFKYNANVEFSHSAILMEIEGEQIVFHSNKHGTHPLLLTKFLEDNEVIDAVDISDEYKKYCFRYSMDKCLNRYSYASIMAIALGLPFGDGSHRMICSELTARSLNLKVDRIDLIDPYKLLTILKTGIRSR